MLIRILAIVWLVALASFAFGVYVSIAKIWPYSVIEEVMLFVEGDEEESTTLVEKVANDIGIKPNRHLNGRPVDLTPFGRVTGLDLNERRVEPHCRIDPSAPKGDRVIFGVLDLAESLHAAIFIDEQCEVKHVWPVSQEDVPWNHESDLNVYPHGLEIAPDGTFVVAYDGGTSLTKYNYCADIEWQVKAGLHHSIEFEGEDAIWSLGEYGGDQQPMEAFLNKVDYRTGELIKKIHFWDIIRANEDIDIFGIRQLDFEDRSEIVWEGGGAWHENDVDPLPAELAHLYPGFEAGDLLISLRSPNLFFVADQDTYRVKWWRQGLVRRQHDPDWNDRGTITVLDNNMHRGLARIVEVDPVTYESNVLIDGEDYQFKTDIRGKHQLLDSGGILVTSTQQGRVFETNAEGDIVFEFLNTYNDDNEYLVVSEAVFLPEGFFTDLPDCES